MNRNINILILEDNPEDAKIIQYQLKKLKSGCTCSIATNRAEFIELLSTFPDLLISDFHLPDIDGFEVLQIVSEKQLSVPVIILSGSIGEETSVDLMLGGANDCVLKDRILRLVPAIERELREAEIKKEKLNAENALLIAKEKAEESDRLKSLFLANISHEIRTPLNGIMGFISLLEPGLEEEKQKEYIKIIDDSGNQLLKIISDIIDVSRIESNRRLIENQVINVNDFLIELNTFYTSLIRYKNPALQFKVTSTCHDRNLLIVADKSKLKQVISNLLENALKFTPSGEIELKCMINGEKIYFTVKDTGIGIAEESHVIIFEHFRQAHNGISQLYGGTGLGLAICKNLIELMGGQIFVKSQVGSGSEFSFFIPVVIPANQDLDAPGKIASKVVLKKEANILIAEDDTNNFILLEEYFRDTNYKIYRADDGSKVYNLLISNKIDMVLMDIKMPFMTGIEATQLIRENNIDVPVIAQTAYTYEYDINYLKSLGFNDLISKPVNKNLLFKKINTLLDAENKK